MGYKNPENCHPCICLLTLLFDFARYRDIDEDMKKELVGLLE